MSGPGPVYEIVRDGDRNVWMHVGVVLLRICAKSIPSAIILNKPRVREVAENANRMGRIVLVVWNCIFRGGVGAGVVGVVTLMVFWWKNYRKSDDHRNKPESEEDEPREN